MTPFIGALLLLCACGVQSAVVELDDNSFYGYAKDRDVLLVDFYAPWCGDCKNLEPDFQAAGVSLGARSIDLAKVDCFGAGKGLCNSFGIKEWPTLKNFNRGKYTGDYTGGLTAGEIAGYVNTVENAASPQAVSNPYAAPYQPMAVATQQCVSRCKISKITNKAPCYAKCKTPKTAARKMLPQPVINEKSCAKCRQPQIAGKFISGESSKRDVLLQSAKPDALLQGAKRDDLLLAAMDGRNAFVLGEKKPNPFDPQIQSPVKPAPGHEEEHLNITTLAKIPGGLQDAREENATETRTLEDSDVPQKIPKRVRSWERQFFQARPVLSRPVNFTVLGMASVKENKTKDKDLDDRTGIVEKTKDKDLDDVDMDDRMDIAGGQVSDVRKTVDTGNPAVQPDTLAVQADTLAAQPDKPALKPETPAVQPDKPVVQPDKPAIQPDKPVVQPDKPTVQPDKPVVQPEKPAIQPDKPVVQPDKPAVQPDKPAAQPHKPAVQPDKPVVQPDKPVKPDKPDAGISSTPARVFEVIKSRKTADIKSNGSLSVTRDKKPPGNIMMSMIQHDVATKERTITSTHANKDAKSTPPRSNRNTAVLLDILTPGEALKLPYVVTDKKKTVAKHRRKGSAEVVAYRKHFIHRTVHGKHSRY